MLAPDGEPVVCWSEGHVHARAWLTQPKYSHFLIIIGGLFKKGEYVDSNETDKEQGDGVLKLADVIGV